MTHEFYGFYDEEHELPSPGPRGNEMNRRREEKSVKIESTEWRDTLMR